MRFRRAYRPWLVDIGSAAAFGSIAVFIVRYVLRDGGRILLLLPAVVLVYAAWLSFRSAVRRVHGKNVEQWALRALGRACPWPARFNIPSPAGGDIDAVIDAPSAQVAVEIKSWGGARVAQGQLVRANGMAIPDETLPQVLRNAQSIGAQPVLWLPASRRARSFVFHGVLVVNGPPDELLDALGGLRFGAT